MSQSITVPDIGDFDSVEIIEILVKIGDQINKNDPIVTLESDKSSVEVPSPFAGKISELKIKIGDKVSKGSLLAKLENSLSDNNTEVEDQKSMPVIEKEIKEKEKKKMLFRIKFLKKFWLNNHQRMISILLKLKSG